MDESSLSGLNTEYSMSTSCKEMSINTNSNFEKYNPLFISKDLKKKNNKINISKFERNY